MVRGPMAAVVAAFVGATSVAGAAVSAAQASGDVVRGTYVVLAGEQPGEPDVYGVVARAQFVPQPPSAEPRPDLIGAPVKMGNDGGIDVDAAFEAFDPVSPDVMFDLGAIDPQEWPRKLFIVSTAQEGEDEVGTASQREAAARGAADFWRRTSGGVIDFEVVMVPGVLRTRADCVEFADWDAEVRSYLFEQSPAGYRDVPFERRHHFGFAPSHDQCPSGRAWTGVPGGIAGNTTVGVVAHELGHNLGLRHSNMQFFEVGEPFDWAPLDSDASWITQFYEYGDLYDVMGTGPANVIPRLNAVHRERLGLRNGVTELGTGQHEVRAFGEEINDVLRFRSELHQATYHVVYRANKFADAEYFGALKWWQDHVVPGLVVTKTYDYDPATTHQLQVNGGGVLVDDEGTKTLPVQVLKPGVEYAFANAEFRIRVDDVAQDSVLLSAAVGQDPMPNPGGGRSQRVRLSAIAGDTVDGDKSGTALDVPSVTTLSTPVVGTKTVERITVDPS